MKNIFPLHLLIITSTFFYIGNMSWAADAWTPSPKQDLADVNRDIKSCQDKIAARLKQNEVAVSGLGKIGAQMSATQAELQKTCDSVCSANSSCTPESNSPFHLTQSVCELEKSNCGVILGLPGVPEGFNEVKCDCKSICLSQQETMTAEDFGRIARACGQGFTGFFTDIADRLYSAAKFIKKGMDRSSLYEICFGPNATPADTNSADCRNLVASARQSEAASLAAEPHPNQAAEDLQKVSSVLKACNQKLASTYDFHRTSDQTAYGVCTKLMSPFLRKFNMPDMLQSTKGACEFLTSVAIPIKAISLGGKGLNVLNGGKGLLTEAEAAIVEDSEALPTAANPSLELPEFEVDKTPLAIKQATLENASLFNKKAKNLVKVDYFSKSYNGSEASADLADVLVTKNKKTGNRIVHLMLGDVSGHGDKFARYSVQLHKIFDKIDARGILEKSKDAADGLVRLEKAIIKSKPPKYDMSISHIAFEPSTGRLEGAGAGSVRAFIVRLDGTVEELPRSGPQFASETLLFKDLPTQVGVHYLNPGDMVVQITDGVAEQSIPEGLAHDEALPKLLSEHAGSPKTLSSTLKQLLRPDIMDDRAFTITPAPERTP
jgi:hypothetical protein